MLRNIPIKVAIKIKPSISPNKNSKTSAIYETEIKDNQASFVLKNPENVDDTLHANVNFIHDANQTRNSIYENCEL